MGGAFFVPASLLRDDAGRAHRAVLLHGVFADRASALTTASQLHLTRLIVSLAMSETIAIMGMVLGMQFGYGPEVTVPFCVLALGLMLVRFPREAALIKQLEAAYGATLPPA